MAAAARGYAWGVCGWGGAPYSPQEIVQAEVDLVVAAAFDPAATGSVDAWLTQLFDPSVTGLIGMGTAGPIDPAATGQLDLLMAVQQLKTAIISLKKAKAKAVDTATLDMIAAAGFDPAATAEISLDLISIDNWTDPAATAEIDFLMVKVFETVGEIDIWLLEHFDPATVASISLGSAAHFSPAVTATLSLKKAKAKQGPTATIDLNMVKGFETVAAVDMILHKCYETIAAISAGVAGPFGVTATADLQASEPFSVTGEADLLASEAFDPAATSQTDFRKAKSLSPSVLAALSLYKVPADMFEEIAVIATVDLFLVKEPFLRLANTDLLDIAMPFDKKGFGGWNIKSTSFPDRRYVRNVQAGANQPIFNLDLYWTCEQGGADEALAALDDIVKNGPGSRLFTRNSFYFYKVDKIIKRTIPLDSTQSARAEIQAVLRCDRVYVNFDREWKSSGPINLPQTSAAIPNGGHFDMPAESLEVTTHHNGTHHVESLVFSVADGDSMTITDRGLDGEKFTLADWLDGSVPSLTAVYEDLVESGTKWARSFTGHGTFSTNKIRLGNSESAYCILSGPYPTKMPVKMEIKMAFTGDPVVEVSLDGGVTYKTAIQDSDMRSSTTRIYTYYLAETVNESNIRVRFTCDSNDVLDIYYLKFTRDLDVSGAYVPFIPVGASNAVSLTCNTSRSLSVTYEAIFRNALEGF